MIHVLYLDDEAHNLTAFRAAFRRVFEVHVTGSVGGRSHVAGVSHRGRHFDQKMPDISGVEFFEMIMATTPIRCGCC